MPDSRGQGRNSIFSAGALPDRSAIAGDIRCGRSVRPTARSMVAGMSAAADQVRADHQPQNREGASPRRALFASATAIKSCPRS
jgi:hypothetical protein